MSIQDKIILKNFCRFISEWFPDVEKISVFGSYMWKKDPQDLDVYLERNGIRAPTKESLKTIFPKIHMIYENPSVPSLREIFKRGGTKIKIPKPDPDLIVREEMFSLRKQIENLKSEIHNLGGKYTRHGGYT